MKEITAQTRVGELLADPALEQALLDFAPAFAKLKNPVLRRTVARIATLQQAAQVADADVGELVQALRRVAGQAESDVEGPHAGHAQQVAAGAGAADDGPLPEWVRGGEVVATVDAEAVLETGEHPLTPVAQAARRLEGIQRVELHAGFRPAPLIDTLRARGHRVHAQRLDARWIIHVAGKSAAGD